VERVLDRSAGGYWVAACAATTIERMSGRVIPAEDASRQSAGIK
jgi:hypothetical protein